MGWYEQDGDTVDFLQNLSAAVRDHAAAMTRKRYARPTWRFWVAAPFAWVLCVLLASILLPFVGVVMVKELLLRKHEGG